MSRLVRAAGVCVCLLGGTTCRSETTPAAPSTTLTGTLQAFSAKGDDYSYYLDIALTAAGGTGATASSADVTLSSPLSKFTAHLALPLARLAAGAAVTEPRIVVPNQTGHPLADTVSMTVNYVDDGGRTGSLLVSASLPACQAFFFHASCAKTNLQVGEVSACSGSVEFGCQPMFEPVDASQIQWQSAAPSIATMTQDFRLIGVSNGTTTLTGAYSGVSMAIPVCVGPLCGASGR